MVFLQELAIRLCMIYKYIPTYLGINNIFFRVISTVRDSEVGNLMDTTLETSLAQISLMITSIMIY